jgi:DNA-binding LacI/PurR family transcriptional regulator
MRHPIIYDPDCPRLGYRQFKALWDLPNRPDGLVVTSDLVAQGAITAILEVGVAAVLPQMKFVFQSNLQFPYLCPFPVTWALYDLDKQAKGLVNLIERQFAGETPQPSFLDFDFQYGSSEVTVL